MFYETVGRWRLSLLHHSYTVLYSFLSICSPSAHSKGEAQTRRCFALLSIARRQIARETRDEVLPGQWSDATSARRLAVELTLLSSAGREAFSA